MKAMRDANTMAVLMTVAQAVTVVALCRSVGGPPKGSCREDTDTLGDTLGEVLNLPARSYGFDTPKDATTYENTVAAMDGMFSSNVVAVKGSELTARSVAGFIRAWL